jgi:hypothetical protein
MPAPAGIKKTSRLSERIKYLKCIGIRRNATLFLLIQLLLKNENTKQVLKQ